MKYLGFLILLLVFRTAAQPFEVDVLFEGIGDNREFSSQKATSQTILGARGAIEAGFTLDGHQFRAGISELYEFGSTIDMHQPKPILYYFYSSEKLQFYFGAFPRRNLIHFPLAMLTDTLLYYRPQIEGMYGGYQWGWGRQNAFVDWISRQTDTIRETFMAGSSGRINYKQFFLDNYLLMYHHAGSGIRIPDDHVKDYLGYSLLLGYQFKESVCLSGYIKAGILSSLYRERSVTDGYWTNNSFLAELKLSHGNYAIQSVLHSGDGHRFYFGDLFYRQKNYLRTDLIWNFINYKNVTGRFNWSLHWVNNERMDYSQQLSIVYRLGVEK